MKNKADQDLNHLKTEDFFINDVPKVETTCSILADENPNEKCELRETNERECKNIPKKLFYDVCHFIASK